MGRLSQAIAEGDGISILVEVSGAQAAGEAERQGADVLAVRTGAEDVRAASQLPVLHLGGAREADEAGADAVVVEADRAAWEDALNVELECVVRVGHEDELERALEDLDPEIFLLSARHTTARDALEPLLALLHDVPAGKLAIAELHDATPADVAELERAGVDGVLVAPGDVAALVGSGHPHV